MEQTFAFGISSGSGKILTFLILFLKYEIIVSNASVCEMKIILNGQEFDAVQLATVGTLPEYQHQGLSRKLIERILEDYKSKTSFFFYLETKTY